MGFFSNMSSINKAYKVLSELEQQFMVLTNMSTSEIARYGRCNLSVMLSEAQSNINKLSDILSTSGSTVQNADFQFFGHKLRLAQIIYACNEMLQRAKDNIRLHS